MSNLSVEDSHHPLIHLKPQQPPIEELHDTQHQQLEDELRHARESESRYKQQFAEAQRREKLLIRRLAAKEQEIQDYASQNAELKASQAPSLATLRSVLLDPAINILFQKLKTELQSTKARLEDTQNELSAWKFTPDSNTGKRLMAKCRLLYQENEELGKMTSNGRLAKLEGDLALQKSFSEEVKKSQSELDDFLQELDEDVEGMQSTILFLQQELKLAKDTITSLERENVSLKNGSAYDTIALKKYKDMSEAGSVGGGGGGGGGTFIENTRENYLINGSRLSATDALIQPIQLDNLNNHGVSSNSTAVDDTPTNLNSFSGGVAGNCEHKTSLNSSNCIEKNSATALPSSSLSSSSSHIVLVETRTLRSSGRNINSVVDELRTSKLKAQYKNGESAIDANSGVVVVNEPASFNELRKNGRKPANKRHYYDDDDDDATSSGGDDHDEEDDDDNNINSHSNSNLNNNNDSNKNNSKDNSAGSGGSNIVTVTAAATSASDCLATEMPKKKPRRGSVLSLDMNDDD